MAITTTPRFDITRWSADTDEVTRAQFDDLVAEIESRSAIDGQGQRSARPAAGVVGRYFTATDTGVVYRDDGVQWRVVGSRLLNAVVRPESSADVALAVQGMSGQSGALQQWLNAGGDVLASMAADGVLTAPQLNATGKAGSHALQVIGVSPDKVVAQVKGAPGQTSALQQWLNSGGSQVAQVTAAGAMTLASGLTAGGQVRGASLVSDGSITAASGVSGTTGRFSTSIAAPNLTGSPTNPVPPFSYRQQAVVQNVQGAGSWEAIIGLNSDPAHLRESGSWSYGSGSWTLPLTGRYHLAAQAGFDPLSGGRRYLRARLGGTVLALDADYASGGGQDLRAIDRSFYGVAGQVVTVELANTAGATAQTVPGYTFVELEWKGTA